MPNLKISAMPGLSTNAAPGDLLTIVDVSAPAATANKHETLNNLLSVITRGITDKALRFQTPGTAPAVSLAAQGAIYFDGSNFQISANGGAYAPLLSLSPQADHAVLIGPTTGGPSAPTWRGLTLSDLPAIATNRLLGRVSPSSPGDVEEIAPGAGVLTWIQTPTVSNLAAAASVSITGNTVTGSWVFSDSPSLVSPRITSDLYTNTNRIILGLSQNGLSTDYLRIENSPASFVNGPLIESVGTSADVNFRIRSKGLGRIQLLTANAVTVSNLSASSGATLEIQDGTVTGARIVIGNLTFNSPLGGFGFYTLPTADGTSGQALITDGAGGLSWTSVLSLTPQADHAVLIGPTSGGPTAPTWRGLTLSDLPTIATNRLLGRVSLSSGDVEQITPGAGVLTWIQTPTAANLYTALPVGERTGSGGPVVFSQSPLLQGLISNGNVTIVGTLNGGLTLPTATAQIVFVGTTVSPTSCLEIRNAQPGAVPILTVNSPSSNYGLEIASKGIATLSLKGSAVSISNNTATAGGIIEARGGSAATGAGSIRLYERTTNGTDYWSWKAPDSLSLPVEQILPDGYGTPGDGMITDGFGTMSWAPLVRTDGAQVVQFGAGTVTAPSVTASGDTNTGLFFPASDTVAITTNGNERLRVTSNGNVGIGTTNPLARFVVGNNGENFEMFIGSPTVNGGGFEYINRTSPSTRPDFNYFLSGSGAHKFYTNAAERMRIDDQGNVGINWANPGARLQVNGTIRYTNRPLPGTVTTIGVDANGDIRESTSSERYKYNIVDYTKGLETVKQLRAREFSYNGEERRNIGFIAEEIDLLGLSEVMLYDSEGLPNAILYGNLVALLVNAIKAQQTQIDKIMETLNETA